MMTKKQRIAELEQRVAELERRVAMLEARPQGIWVPDQYWNGTTPFTKVEPFRFDWVKRPITTAGN
jgi:hypothetical protein